MSKHLVPAFGTVSYTLYQEVSRFDTQPYVQLSQTCLAVAAAAHSRTRHVQLALV